MTDKQEQADIQESIAERLLHCEVLLTLHGLKPLSIVRAFNGPQELEAWSLACASGAINRPDLIWRTKSHESGLIGWFASKSALKPFSDIQGLNTERPGDEIFSAIERHAEHLGDFESHRLWGNLLGYPSKQVEKYALARTTDKALWDTRSTLSLFPKGLASRFSGTFSAFDPETDPEIMRFHQATGAIATRFQELRATRNSHVEILNQL